MATIKDKLNSFEPQQSYLLRKILSVSENGKKYSITFPSPKMSAVFQIDNYIIKDGQKCDKLIIFSNEQEEEWTEVFIELKGKDIEHAINQIDVTLKKEIFKDPSVTLKKARIVGSRIPKSTGNSVLDRAKIKFIKDYRCDLRAVNPGITEKFN